MAEGLTTLELISKPGFYTSLAARTERLVTGLAAAARDAGIALATNQV